MNELEEIRKKKLEELMKKMSKQEKQQNYPSRPITITDDDFEKTIQQYQLLLIDFWAPWCHPCRIIAPVIEDLAKDYAGTIVFGKLNTDENPRTAMKFGIMSIPTLLIIKNGKVVDKILGAVPREYIEPKLKKYIRG